MKSQRGSMAVIALIMMLFLLIVGVAWLPMLADENKTAQNDWEEQQAWYAAEAGFVRAKTALNNSTSGGEWSWLAKSTSKRDLNAAMISISDDVLTNMKQAKYAVYISPSLAAGSTPAAATEYSVTAVGQVNGMQKVLKRVVTTAASSTDIILPGLIQAGGKVTVENSNYNITGDIYGAEIKDKTGNQKPTKNENYIGVYPNILATKIPDSVFLQSNYANLTTITPTGLWDAINIRTSGNYLLNWPLAFDKRNNWEYLLTSTSDVTLFVHSTGPITFYTTNGIVGPTDTTKPPLTIIFDNDVIFSGGPVTGNVRILAKGAIDYEVNGSDNDRIMIASNGYLQLGRKMVYGLLSSNYSSDSIPNNSILLKNSCPQFVGQIIAKAGVDIQTGSVTYSDIVSKTTGFIWPKGMQ
jgi:hypothetical protein